MTDQEFEEMKDRVAQMKEESKQRIENMTPEQRKQPEETSRRFSRKCEIPKEADLTIKTQKS